MMGKNRNRQKRKSSKDTLSSTPHSGKPASQTRTEPKLTAPSPPAVAVAGAAVSTSQDDSSAIDFNPLYTAQHEFLSSLSPRERDYFFSQSTLSPERRAELWMQQADIGESMVNRYAWATPNETCLKIFQEFSPLIELGCGRNAYWANFIKQKGNVDVVAFDTNVEKGGMIGAGKDAQQLSTSKKKKHKHKIEDSSIADGSKIRVHLGGPEVLSRPEHQHRTLFLCYPDEEDVEACGDSSQGKESLPFGWQCLDSYRGQYVIHVGELAFLDANLSIDQAPWGRSSSLEFQQRLASEFHCLLKVQLPNWLHVRDSISVWKRSDICPIVFVADELGDDDEDEIVEYRHIPPDEMLPREISAPCLAHLLVPREATLKVLANAIHVKATSEKRKRTNSQDDAACPLDDKSGDGKAKEE